MGTRGYVSSGGGSKLGAEAMERVGEMKAAGVGAEAPG